MDKKTQYMKIIRESMNNCLVETDLPLPEKKRGKVRDSYSYGPYKLFITTDRQSAFDRILAAVPFKGQVLNLTSAWWFDQTKHIIKNHVISVPDANVTAAVSCSVFPIEFVVRGYITGSTETSLWTRYNRGDREYCGNSFPDGLKKNEKLPEPVLTPTTKEEHHDRPITPAEIVSEGWMSAEDWETASQKALELFAFGQKTAEKHGLILVDTKYEMGKDADGNILLIDELHTPDSSRYWLADSCEERVSQGLEPKNIDKEFLRLWFKEHCDPYADAELPEAPEDLVAELSYRYITLYEMITGKSFQFPPEPLRKKSVSERIEEAFPHWDLDAENEDCWLVRFIMGSESDRAHAEKISQYFTIWGIPWEINTASAHKNPLKVLEILEQDKRRSGSCSIVYITIAGRSNALSGFTAANTSYPVIACPPFSDKVDMMVNINSTLQMPSRTPVLTVIDPGNAALAAKRILELAGFSADTSGNPKDSAGKTENPAGKPKDSVGDPKDSAGKTKDSAGKTAEGKQ